jgi:glycosyltransferase involved in cell wall biosynthesis
MKISVCLTVLDEEKTIGKVLEGLLEQTKKPDEIVIVDGGSTDKTVEIIRHFQKKDKSIKLVVEKCSISQGRNLSISLAKNEIVALTDAGCEPYRDWLENLVYFLRHKEIGIVAGFYEMPASTPLGKVISCYLGVPEERFDPISFLPSTRSVAFRKEVWEKLGGFDESLKKTGEDSLFFYRAVKSGVKIARAKEARVVWGEPGKLSLKKFFGKVSSYACGDIKSKIFWHPSKGLMSHNIKIILVFARYILFLFLSVQFLRFPRLYFWVPFLFLLYLLWPIYKWRDVLKTRKERLYLPLVQIVSDFAVILGLLKGIFER